MARALTMAEVREINEMGGQRGTVARFTHDGRGFDVLTGEHSPRGTNVLFQPVYWDLSKEQAKRAAELSGANLREFTES